ncbi:hypothetical protein CF319_g8985, partial [Tilletia indica]
MASIRGRTDYSDGKAQDDSVKDTGGWHLRTTGTAQTARRDGETTGGDLTAAKAKLVREGEGERLSYEGSERRHQGPPPIGTACAGTSRRCGRPRDGRINGTQRKAIRPNLVWVHAISASVYRSGLVMPTILDRIHQALSAQRCNEEIFKGKDLKPQATRARLTATPDGKRRNARSLASTATVEQGSKTEDDSVEKTDRFKVSRRKARPPISPQQSAAASRQGLGNDKTRAKGVRTRPARHRIQLMRWVKKANGWRRYETGQGSGQRVRGQDPSPTRRFGNTGMGTARLTADGQLR